jgi:hypothetical protein
MIDLRALLLRAYRRWPRDHCAQPPLRVGA